jgi:hypothetical protein
MQINKEIQFEEIVMLLDATYLDSLVGQLSEKLGQHLGRELPRLDLSVMLECLALDAGIRPEQASTADAENAADTETAAVAKERRIQVLFIYDQQWPRLQHLQPADLKTDLNDQAFRSPLGEFVVNSYPSTEFAGRTDFFVEALKLVTDSKETRLILAVPDENACGDAVKDELAKGEKAEKPKAGKIFGLQNMDTPMFENMAFALMRALGVKSEELK